MSDLSRFSIYRNPPKQPKREEESHELMPFLLRLEQYIKLDDVESGPDPPDFVFRHEGNDIGVELTDLLPKECGPGGFARRADFKPWMKEVKRNPLPRHEFDWGQFTLRQSLTAFASQLDSKSRKTKRWAHNYSERWLLMHVGPGGPFAELVANKRLDEPGHESQVADFLAKSTHALFTVCQRPHPFDYIILFSGTVLLAFSSTPPNPYRLPVPTPETLARGATLSDTFLDWGGKSRGIVEHPLLASPENSSAADPQP